MTAPTPDGGMVLPSGAAGVPARGTLAAALGRVRGWWARCARPTPARLWESAADGTGAFRPGSTGLTLTCRAGTFLVTQAGDPVDHVLEAGDSFRTISRGRVAAWALRSGTLEVGTARPKRANWSNNPRTTPAQPPRGLPRMIPPRSRRDDAGA